MKLYVIIVLIQTLSALVGARDISNLVLRPAKTTLITRNTQFCHHEINGTNFISKISEQSTLASINAYKYALRIAKATVKRTTRRRFLDLAIFLGYKAHVLLTGTLHIRKHEISSFFNDYVRQIEAIFNQPFLRSKMTVRLTHIDIHRSEESSLCESNIVKLLETFCEYQRKRNTANGKKLWDIAIYLTSQDLYSVVDGRQNWMSMGLAPIGGICTRDNNCVVSEFGVINKYHKPEPSGVLASAWIVAHEIAHNLGVFHDGDPMNNCSKNGFLMSPNKGSRGESRWSPCAQKLLDIIEPPCLIDPGKEHSNNYQVNDRLPGEIWNANAQCQLFLQDQSAIAKDSLEESVCNDTLWCMSSKSSSLIAAGAALEGTLCGSQKWCIGTSCEDKSV